MSYFEVVLHEKSIENMGVSMLNVQKSSLFFVKNARIRANFCLNLLFLVWEF